MEDVKPSRYLAEFVGTFLLVFTVGCNVIDGSPVWAATSIACILMVTVYAFAPSSGANFNPAVSLALGICGKLAWLEVLIYCCVQLLAGTLAAVCYGVLYQKVFNLAPTAGFGWWEAGLVEVLYTFMLCFVVLNCAASERNNPPENGNQFYGLAIGFVIVAGGYGGGAISGGCFNPAVAMGIDISSAGIGFGWGPAYVGFELVGAALAGLLFRVVRPEEFGAYGDIPIVSKLVSEFLGTYMLVLTVGLNVLGKSPAAAWSIAAALMCMIFSLGQVSGAHFNPAVTVAVACSRRNKISPVQAAQFVGMQLLGGITAGLTFSVLHHWSIASLGPSKNYGWAAVGVAEIVFTFVLCFVVLSVACVDKPLSQYFGLAIGSCVTAGGIAVGGISGGALNPAVALGIASGSFGTMFVPFLAYFAFELVGAAIAAGAFYLTHPSEYSPKIF